MGITARVAGIAQAGAFLIALLAFHNEAIHLVRLVPYDLRQAIFLMLGEVVEIQVHLLGKVRELDIEFCFIV